MTDSNILSRRDWFRLRIPHQNKMLESFSESAIDASGDSQTGLRPIQNPPNHDGLDLSELPPMREATLSAEQVTQLFFDIEQLATDVCLMQRQTGAQRASSSKADTSTKLEAARTALLSGTVTRLQLRYQWQDQHWIDTLKRAEDEFHLVRIAHGLT